MDINKFDWTEGLENKAIFSNDKVLIFKMKKSKYVTQNIPGPGCEMDDFEDKLLGCQCLACDRDCKCTAQYGNAYKDKKIDLTLLGSSVTPVFECNSNCSCPSQCQNRVVQHGISVQLQIFNTDNKGLGLQTLEKIQTGTFVCEYAGEIISLQEAQSRCNKQKNTDMNYILTVKEHCKNGILKTYVDPDKLGNIGRYINHSCSPNLSMVPIRVDTMVPKVCLFANRDIEPLEELSFVYGILRPDQKTGTKCYCNSNVCTGFMPFDEELKSSFDFLE
ncbi:histone-lysine N-methyltransferase SETMAR [Mytilus galloprovincialis]|uniref:Histone-lysine N-methyltransferase SETMAR n=1 Tax=Mytilus galloprovincialis TaxID=29158 RepID=A0A8B6CR15_MYTGA|nr:histone-lysine N-methyltransferase SETMAR [Mytilus galloprovincialis]